MSKGIRAKLSAIQEKLAGLEEANAKRDQVDMPSDIDWSDTSSAEAWYGLHVERKRAWIRANFVIVLHRHSRGSARVFDPGTVQIIHKANPAITATPDIVEQWRLEHATWSEPMPYGLMLQPQLGPEPRPVQSA